MALISTIVALAAFAIFARFALQLLSSFRPTDRTIPGPLAARFTTLWYARQMRRGDFHFTNIKLHEECGPVVRIAPNHYSLSDPESLKVIYGLGSGFVKSSWYEAWNIKSDLKLTNLFSERDPKQHSANRRKVASMYSMTALTAYEPYVDHCIGLLQRHLDHASAQLSVIDLGHWCQCYAFDVIGEITFGERFGFLDHFKDISGVIATIDSGIVVSIFIGLYMWVRPVLFFALRSLGLLASDGLFAFAQKHIDAASSGKGEPTDAIGGMAAQSPMLQKFIAAKYANSGSRGGFTDWDVMSNVLSNVGAGSDTTALSLSAVFYYTYTSPGTLKKLRAEIDAADLGDLPLFKETQKLPYLQAVLLETLRIHPGTGFPLFRVVPEGGALISGQFFPQNANVGVNSWVIHRNKDIFGHDADVFRPERWLEASEAEKSAMDRALMPFGLGSRTCIGKNISLLEMNKLIPVVVRQYDLEILEPSENMRAKNHWFVKPVDLKTRIRPRKDKI